MIKRTSLAEVISDYLKDLAASGVTNLPETGTVFPFPTPSGPVPTGGAPSNGEAALPETKAGTSSPRPDSNPLTEKRSERGGTGSPSTPTGTSLPLVSPSPQPHSEEEESSDMVTAFDRVLKKIRPDAPPEERADRLRELAKVVARCSVCPELTANRTQTVFGTGDPSAELVFVGEGPGADEDRQGVPFVGRSGQLLTDIITKGMKMRREDVYICNIVRCRPPGNRNPTGIEAQCCRPFLDATLSVIGPKYICCLGAVAATNLLETTEPIGRLRGKVHDLNGVKVVCTYHPAYLLRNPAAKGQCWEDIKLLLRTMGRMK